jgi:MULE transposase domain
MKKKEYYHLIRYRRVEKTDPDTIVALLQALNDQGFTYRTMTEDEYEENEVIVSSRKLQQIFFFFSEGLELCRRFCAGHLLIIDATFNTNRHRLPILVAVGITNEGRTFLVAYSYCPSESATSFSFFECLQQEVFPDYNGIPAPAVILADQAAGLIKAVNEDDALPLNSRLLFCSWHAAQAIIAKLRKGKYTSDELDGYKDTWGNGIPGLKDLTWWYIESPTLAELELNRQNLLDRLDPDEQAYIKDCWVKKEDRVIRAYTSRSKNLSCFATQRVESYHRIIQSVTNGQMTLENSVKSIAERTTDFYRVLAEDEDRARLAQRTDIDNDAFRALIGRVSLRAIDLIKPE